MVHPRDAGYTPASAPQAATDADLENVSPSPNSQVDPYLSSAISNSGREHGGEPVFPLIHRIRNEVTTLVDAPLSWRELTNVSFNFTVVRPLVLKLSKGDRPAISLIFAILVCRTYFVGRSDDDLAFASVNTSRADLCELLAIKLLSAYGTAPGSFELLNVLTATFSPFSGATLESFAPEENVDEQELRTLQAFGKDSASNALELGIFSKAKRFVKTPLVQQVIKAIYEGDVIYSPESNHALIQDTYKDKPVVEIYDWRRRPFLDHHRLRVPHIRARLEYASFAIMLGLFLVVQSTYSPSTLDAWELLYIFWGIGFALDEWFAILENGLTSHFGVSFNLLDAVYVVIFASYLILRIIGLHQADEEMSKLALDTLSLAGCVLLPRVTISLLKDNVVLLALSKMVKEFVLFLGLTVLTASGFLVTFHVLSHGTWSFGHLSWLLLRIHLGSAFLGFEVAQQFHPVYGPILMVLFAVLSQTLLLTILISLLSNTFAAVQANAETELLFQKALRTIERVKADPLSLYVAPSNVVALVVLFPLRFVASPYVLHKSQVYLCRFLNLPTLLFLALHTRATHASRSPLYLASQKTQRVWASVPRSVSRLGGVVAPLWEGSAEVLAERVFEREVSRKGRSVPGLDDEEEDEGATETAPAPSTTTKKPQQQQLKKQRPGPSPKGGVERLGSLTSPLARIFGASALNPPPSPTSTSAASSSTAPPTAAAVAAATADIKSSTSHAVEAGQQGLQDRLDRIEEMMQVLLGEVVRIKKEGGGGGGEEGEEKSSVPLTSLTGAIEESYVD